MVAGPDSRGFEALDYRVQCHQQALQDGVGLSVADTEAMTIDYPDGESNWFQQRPDEDPGDFCDRVSTRPLPEKQLRTNKLGIEAARAALAASQAPLESAPPLTESERIWALARRRARDERRGEKQ